MNVFIIRYATNSSLFVNILQNPQWKSGNITLFIPEDHFEIVYHGNYTCDDFYSMNGITLFLDNQFDLPLLSVPLFFMTTNLVIPFSTVNPLRPFTYQYYVNNVETVRYAFEQHQVTPFTQWTSSSTQSTINQSSELVIDVELNSNANSNANSTAVFYEISVTIPPVPPTLLVLMFRYYGSLEVRAHSQKLASFCPSLSCGHSQQTDILSYPIVMLSSLINPSNQVSLTLLNVLPSNSTFNSTSFHCFAFFDIQEEAIIRSSYSKNNLDSFSHDYNFLTYTTSGISDINSFQFRNHERMIASSFKIYLVGYSERIDLWLQIQLKTGEFAASTVPVTTPLFGYNVIEVSDVFGDVEVEEYIITLSDIVDIIVEVVPVFKATSIVCEDEDSFLMAPNNIISAVSCRNDTQWGIFYRRCVNGVWDHIHDDLCYLRTPFMEYEFTSYIVYSTVPFRIEPLVQWGVIDYCTIQPMYGSLPSNITIDRYGVIQGMIEFQVGRYMCIISAGNQMTAYNVHLTIIVYYPLCTFFEMEPAVDTLASIPCGEGYTGEISYKCIPSTNTPTGGEIVFYSSNCRLIEYMTFDDEFNFVCIFILLCIVVCLGFSVYCKLRRKRTKKL